MRSTAGRTWVPVLLVAASVAALLAVAPARPAAAAVLAGCTSGPATTPAGVPRFWTTDRACYLSPWFDGAHRLMIGFGCTRAPYYDHDPACPGRQGVHHGVDIDMPVGTRVFSAVSGTVVTGTLGSAYGPKAFLVRTSTRDYVLGHVGRVYVRNGQHVTRGQLVALSDRLGAPDGPHLHVEVRPRGGSYRSALDPTAPLRLVLMTPSGCC